MTTELELLHCASCSAPIALVDEASLPCPFCGATVTIPHDHREALRAAREGQAARTEAGSRLEALGQEPQPAVLWLAVGAMLLLPSLAVFLAARSGFLGLSELELTAHIGLPAALPGAGAYLWAMIASGTSRRFCVALGAAPPTRENGPLCCRNCGAPLAEPEVGHLVRCAYCRCDNLLLLFDLDGLQANLRSTLQTLDQALRLMRFRRAQWALGIGFAVVLCGGLVALVLLAQQ